MTSLSRRSCVLRPLAGALLATLMAACSSAPPAVQATSPGTAPRPRLVVLLVVDGLPMRQVTGYRDQLAPDGLARFLDRGTWYADAHYGHAFTVTAAGHATMLTGAYSHRSGIIGNDWRDAGTGQPEYCTGDTSATYIGHRTQALDGTSPKNLKAETVGDVLRRLDSRSKVIGISGKDRGAILPAGRMGTAYMYMGATGQFASSTYYMKEHPAWANAFNAAKPADRYFGTEWAPLLPDAAYARSLADEQKWFGPGGKLPRRFGGGDEPPGPRFYSSLLQSPFVDALSLDFARAAIAGEQLGQDDVPDVLSVSLSGHDYVNHAYSAESRLSHDHLLQLDRLFQAFFRDLDALVGKDQYVAVLTADHGFMPAPERSAQLGQASGRVDARAALARINAALDARFGPAKWLHGFSGSGLLINKATVAEKKADANAVAEEARRAVLAEPGIAAAYTRAELLAGSRASEPLFAQIRKSWHPDVSGDVQYALQPYWMVGNTPATHGSPYAYDTHVPILMYGPRWLQPGRVDTRVGVADIAPTLAGLLAVPVPAQSEGKPLPQPGR